MQKVIIFQPKSCCLLLIFLAFSNNIYLVKSTVTGGCYEKCQNVESSDNRTGSQNLAVRLSNFSSLCSCHSSCKVYKDCCYDSSFRTEDLTPTRRILCITLTNKGAYKTVAKCSRYWTESSEFCSEGIGHLPPVTSKISGTTYANTHCAICNEDAEDLMTWNVDLRCCEEHDQLEDQSARRFVSRGRYIESVLETPIDGIRPSCICKHYARYDDTSFTDSLELRKCEPKMEISRCSSTWGNERVRELCAGFLDPVYARENVYRNVHCAQCNYERIDLLSCQPPVVKQMLSEGKSEDEILAHCRGNNLFNCIHFYSIQREDSRGRSYAFSSLLNINEQGCIPEEGKRCCAGERYDFRSKRCKKIH